MNIFKTVLYEIYEDRYLAKVERNTAIDLANAQIERSKIELLADEPPKQQQKQDQSAASAVSPLLVRKPKKVKRLITPKIKRRPIYTADRDIHIGDLLLGSGKIFDDVLRYASEDYKEEDSEKYEKKIDELFNRYELIKKPESPKKDQPQVEVAKAADKIELPPEEPLKDQQSQSI